MAISAAIEQLIFFFFCKETTLHGKKSSWLLDMFQLDLSKIKEVQTDESLKGTGKMPVYVLAFVYTSREKKILSQTSSLTTERITTAINLSQRKKRKTSFTLQH